jgi:hypothetical protein
MMTYTLRILVCIGSMTLYRQKNQNFFSQECLIGWWGAAMRLIVKETAQEGLSQINTKFIGSDYEFIAGGISWCLILSIT